MPVSLPAASAARRLCPVPSANQRRPHPRRSLLAEHVEGSLSGGAGDLYWQGWLPADGSDVKGVVALVHGLHEHSGRYAHVGERLAGDGYPTYAVDHAGHGRSGGVRGNIGRMAEVVSGVHALTQFAADRHAGAPVFVLGHSMGGLIALQY
ncbi:MAG: alpha/beta fold hydrolase, partial [Micromonosporaceae bacterium]|nr:alpha/beta fold hydrolase [Micromonosporaceae bacterium]